MCGLAGIVGEVDLMEQVLLHMSAAQNHRGKETPNSWVSSFIDARVGLMHNRMKTIDMADRKSTRLNSSHKVQSRMPSSA